jgi:hypothetical protein
MDKPMNMRMDILNIHVMDCRSSSNLVIEIANKLYI